MTFDVCTRRFVAAAATLTLMFGVAVWGQSKGEPAARDADEAFDVISVKRHPGERARNASAMHPGGRLTLPHGAGVAPRPIQAPRAIRRRDADGRSDRQARRSPRPES